MGWGLLKQPDNQKLARGPSAQGGIFAAENISEERNGSGMDINPG